MQYLGGKSRISNQISSVLNKYTRDKNFVSLFCGTCSIESKVDSKSKLLNDKHYYLIEMLKAVQGRYDVPDNVSREEYYKIKSNQ